MNVLLLLRCLVYRASQIKLYSMSFLGSHGIVIYFVCAADENEQKHVIHNLFQHFDPTQIIVRQQQIVSASDCPVAAYVNTHGSSLTIIITSRLNFHCMNALNLPTHRMCVCACFIGVVVTTPSRSKCSCKYHQPSRRVWPPGLRGSRRHPRGWVASWNQIRLV